jgi:hypothetical protein
MARDREKKVKAGFIEPLRRQMEFSPRKLSLTFLLPFLADHFMEASAHGVGEGEEFAVTVKLNRFARSVHYHLAMAAFVQMRSQLAFEVFGHVAIEKI